MSGQKFYDVKTPAVIRDDELGQIVINHWLTVIAPSNKSYFIN